MNKNLFNNKRINTFLSFKYIPRENIDIPKKIIESCSRSKLSLNRTEVIKKGKKSLEKGFRKILLKYPEDVKFIVPLSAGLDSRPILGFLLKNVKKSRIITFTFGTPGTLDYEIGRKVAKKAGVKHYTIDCTPKNFDWTEKFLLNSAKKYKRPKILFGMGDLFRAFQAFLDKNLEEKYVFLTGFLGGVLAGCHLPKQESKTWKEAIDYFLTYNYTNPNLISSGFDPKSALPNEPLIKKEILSYDEQLDFGIRQKYYIKPSAILNENFKTPYFSKPWLDFILNVQWEFKEYRDIFREIILDLYPELFSVGVSTNAGLPLSVNPIYHEIYRRYIKFSQKLKRELGYDLPSFNTNFFDWDVELRRSESLLRQVKKQLEDLEERNRVEWIEPKKLLKSHLKRKRDLGSEIRILTSLEIFLKIQEC